MNTNIEEVLGAMLRERTADIPPVYEPSDELLHRTRARRTRKLVGVNALGAVLLVGAIAGAASLGSQPNERIRTPADTTVERPDKTVTTPTTPTTTLNDAPMVVPSVACLTETASGEVDTRSAPPAAADHGLDYEWGETAPDPSRFAAYTSDDENPMTVLARRGWSCRAVANASGGHLLEIGPSEGDGTVSVTAEPVPNGTGIGIGLACQYFSTPALVAEAEQFDMTCDPAATSNEVGRTLLDSGDDTRFFDIGDDVHGVAILQVEGELDPVDDILVLTCRPTDGLTPADCDTIVAEYAARNSADAP